MKLLIYTVLFASPIAIAVLGHGNIFSIIAALVVQFLFMGAIGILAKELK